MMEFSLPNYLYACFSLWQWWERAVVVSVLAAVAVKVGDAVALVRVAAVADDEAERVVLARVRAAPLQLHAARRTGESCEGEVKGRISKVVFKVSHQVEKDVSSTLLQ